MAANVETMFSVRKKPWHGLGIQVQTATTSKEAIRLAGVDWKVRQEEVYTWEGRKIPGYRVNLRSSDGRALGIVTERYQVLQNEEAFAFTDALLGEGVTYETAGSLQEASRKEGGSGFWQSCRNGI